MIFNNSKRRSNLNSNVGKGNEIETKERARKAYKKFIVDQFVVERKSIFYQFVSVSFVRKEVVIEVITSIFLK